ncbi:MAG: type II secretion system protein GspD, partial [Planctomycetota bacterium]
DRKLRQLLDERLAVELDFPDFEFSEVISFLKDITGANIYVNWNALSMMGIDRTAPVNVQLKDVMFRKALEIILDDVGGVTPLSFLIDGGVITISTKEALSRRTLTRVYDIRDLILRVPDFTGPSIDIAQAGEESGGAVFAEEDSEAEELEKAAIIENIIALIQETIEPSSWRLNGGLVGSISELHGQLVVTQTSENHQQLLKLIAQLREARALQISIEARFISVNTGFLNSIGLDLDFYFNIGSRLGSTSVIDPFTGASVPTTAGSSGWGTGQPGDNKWTPLAVRQGSSTFASVLGRGTPIPGGSIGLEVTNSALSLGGTFLDDIQVDFLIQATQAHSATRSLTAPRLTLYNGQQAYVVVATQQAYVSDLEPVVSENAIAFNPTIDSVATGSVLQVEATISADRRYVTLTVIPQVLTLNGFGVYFTTVTDTDAAGDPITGIGQVQLPNITIQKVATTVSVPDGGTLLLGGQRLSGEIEREMGVPLLNKIPILNRMFTNRGTVRDEQTLLILIKPKIIIQQEEEEQQFPG